MTPVLATWFTRQLVFDGLVSGATIGLLALGLVLVYRSTRVINFAVANLGVVGAALLPLMVLEYGGPFWLSLVAALAAGALAGAAVELAIVRRLFHAPRVVLLIATIGIAQLALAGVVALPDLGEGFNPYPVAIGSTWDVLGVDVHGAQLTILLVVPVVAGLLGWFLNRTMVGQSVQAAAENPDLARLSAISPKNVSTLVWTIAGLLATLSMILIAGDGGTASSAGGLGPGSMARALAAATLARFASFPRALVAGIALGVAESLLRFNFLDQRGLIDAVLLLAVIVAVWAQSRGPGETAVFSFGARVRPVPARLRELWWVRRMGLLGWAAAVALAFAVPLVVDRPSRLLLYATVATFAICGVSVTVLTGWAGQLSLGQMAFAGLGALLAAGLQRGLSVDIGWGDARLLQGTVPSLPFLESVLLATVLVAVGAAVLGVGSLQVRGLLLAVTTFAFAVAAQSYLFNRPLLSPDGTTTVPMPRAAVFGFDLAPQANYYVLTVGTLAIVVALVARLRSSGIGRVTIAVRDNAGTAAAYAVGPTLVKLRAFALAGGIAAFGGALLGGLVVNVPVTGRLFTVNDSLSLVAIAVIGGVSSAAGPVLGSLWVIGLPAFFPGNDVVPLLTSSIGMLVLLLYVPGGFVQVGYLVRDALLARVEARLGEGTPGKTVYAVPARTTTRRAEVPTAGTPWLEAADIEVAFGGVAAVDHVDLTVGPREVVGLIGTNGAGKTTLMGAVSGAIPSRGVVRLLGHDVSGLPAHRRAARGLGRTFQAATLFPELTVRDTVLVALESRGRSRLLSTAAGAPWATRAARARHAEASELIDFLGLGRYADHHIADLSTGTRRIVELAGLLALDARVLCLDEPTAGVAQRETEAFGPLLVELARELDASVLIIEHDMPLIMSISDRVYCLELGRVIAEGRPDAVRNDPKVIASYLGLDERAIERSDRAPLAPRG